MRQNLGLRLLFPVGDAQRDDGGGQGIANRAGAISPGGDDVGDRGAVGDGVGAGVGVGLGVGVTPDVGGGATLPALPTPPPPPQAATISASMLADANLIPGRTAFIPR